MSAISQKSISGITSITTPAGVDDVFTVHSGDTTERFRVDRDGNQNISGIVTATNCKTGSSNLHSTGLTVGDSFVHATGVNASSLDIDDFISVGSNIHFGNAGIITATTIKSSNLTANRVVFTTTGGQLEASGNLTYNGTTLASGSPLDINSDLDVDGHTNLDNVSVAGVSTFSGNVHLPDNVELNLGTNNDLEIFHNDDDAYIRNNKGALILRNNNQTGDADASQIYIQATPAENSIQCSPNGAVTLFHNNVPQLVTTTAGVSLYRDLDVDGHTNLDNVSIAGVTTFSGDIETSKNIVLGDGSDGNASINRLKFGASGDLQIYHNQYHSKIVDGGTGALIISGSEIRFETEPSSTERLRIEDGLVTLFDSTGAYHKPTLKIANQYHGRYGGSLVFTAENNSGTEYTTARIRAYGGGSDTGGQIGVGCGDFNGDGDKIRIYADGKIAISPTGQCTSYNNAMAVTVIQTGGTNGYPGIHLKSLKSGGDEGMSFIATDDNWDLYTRAGNENGLGILRAGSAASSNARFYLTQGGNLTVGDHTYTDLATSKKGHTMMHVAGGGLSVGPKGNTATTTEGGRYVLGWYMVTHNTTNSYTHLITDMWAGGSPHGNNEYIMGGFHIHGHQYSGGASVGRERIYFHNWSGGYAGKSNSNPGNWTPGNDVYTHSTGYVALRLLGGSYRGYIIDLVQHAWYPVRDINVTSVVQSSSSTL